MKIQKFDVNISDEYMKNFRYGIKYRDRYYSEMYLNFDLVKDIQNILVRGELFYKFSQEYKPFLVNITVNLCDTLKNKSGTFYANQILRIFWKNSQYVTSNFFNCPFESVSSFSFEICFLPKYINLCRVFTVLLI